MKKLSREAGGGKEVNILEGPGEFEEGTILKSSTLEMVMSNDEVKVVALCGLG